MPTHRELLAAGAERLLKADVPDARSDAKRLLLAAFQMTPADFILAETDNADAAAAKLYEQHIERRARREPVSSILGTVDFFGLTFISDARALTPRQDSEVLVETVIDCLKQFDRPRILDLGTGSGCLLLSALHSLPAATGVGVDVSEDALTLAAENAEALSLSDRVAWQHADWAKTDLNLSGYDAVISNPPYISHKELKSLAPEVLSHDPMTALDGGPDGLDAYRRLIDLAAASLDETAWLIFEIGWTQKQAVRNLLHAARFATIADRTDYAGKDRVVYGRKRPPETRSISTS